MVWYVVDTISALEYYVYIFNLSYLFMFYFVVVYDLMWCLSLIFWLLLYIFVQSLLEWYSLQNILPFVLSQIYSYCCCFWFSSLICSYFCSCFTIYFVFCYIFIYLVLFSFFLVLCCFDSLSLCPLFIYGSVYLRGGGRMWIYSSLFMMKIYK